MEVYRLEGGALRALGGRLSARPYPDILTLPLLEDTPLHLVIDGYGCDPEQLSDAEHVRRFLDTYPGAIGMTKISVPSVQVYQGPVPDDWGVSGFVIIAESHISVHTFPDRAYVNIDVFSCKEFDADQALREIRALFTIADSRHWVLDRGLEHLNPATAHEVVKAERTALYSEAG